MYYPTPVVVSLVVWALWFTSGLWIALKGLVTVYKGKFIEDFKNLYRAVWLLENLR